MNLFTSVLFFKIALLAGLSLWITIAVLNDIVAFSNGVAAVDRLMNMQPRDRTADQHALVVTYSVV